MNFLLKILQFSECDISYQEPLFNTLFAKLENYVNADAQQTIQWIIDGKKYAESIPCDLECQKKYTYELGILGTTKLKSQVSGRVRELASNLIALDEEAFKEFNEVSPNDTVRIKTIGCKLLCNKNKLLQKFEQVNVQ